MSRKSAKSDAVAGLTVALVNVPSTMAYAILAGISPLYGLYSGIVPPIMAGLFASSAFMVVTLTSEMALMTASLLEQMGSVAIGVVFMFTVLIGLWQLLFGYFKLGRFLRFISQSVMTGFVTGLAVIVILGQISELLGASSEYSNKVLAALDILFNPSSWHGPTAILGISMIAIIIIFHKTRLSKFSLIASLIAITFVTWVAGVTSVELVGDISQIPRQLPLPTLPDFSAIPELIVPALSTAILGVAVAAGVAQNFPNPDGNLHNSNRDFIGLGTANTIGGIFQSAPSTASLSRTAANIEAGAKSRLALIFSGLLMAVVIMTVGPLAELIPMTALAGLLIYVSVGAINKQKILRGWQTHLPGRLAMIFTFIMTLTIDLITALLAGILLSLALYIYQSSLNVRVRELEPIDKRVYKERKTPAEFPSNQVTVLQFYGSSLFAAVDTMEKKLPSAENTNNAAIIFVKRDIESVNNTYLTWLQRYTEKLHKSGNILFLAEVEAQVKEQMEKTEVIKTIGEKNIFLAQPVIGLSIGDAINAANQWLRQRPKETA